MHLLSARLPSGLGLLPDPTAAVPWADSCERLSLPPWHARPGGQRGCHVPPMYRGGEGRVSTPVARHPRWRNSRPPDLATYLLVQAVQQLALVLCDDAYDASPGLTCATRSWFPTALLLAVAVKTRAWAALPEEEATLCWELRTLRLRKARPSRIPLAEQRVRSLDPPNAVQLHRRPRVAPERQSPATGPAGETLNSESRHAGPGSCNAFVRPFLFVPLSYSHHCSFAKFSSSFSLFSIAARFQSFSVATS
jgi:hypothetical protein